MNATTFSSSPPLTFFLSPLEQPPPIQGYPDSAAALVSLGLGWVIG